jgi:dihydroorotase
MGFDYIIEGNCFVNGEFQPCCFGVEDERISSVKKILTGAMKKKFFKQKILPAGIDIHVHFRDPGYPEKETFKTGSIAAAFGGISCVFEMPNTNPQTTTKFEIINKIKHINKQSVIDFGVYGGITDINLQSIHEFFPIVPGLKVFLGDTTNSLEFSINNIKKLFHLLKSSSKPILFHAEDPNCLNEYKKHESSLIDHHNNRPGRCEEKAISALLSYEPFSCPVHICHVSSIEGLNLLSPKKGIISYGVTPHHSLLNIENLIKQPIQSLYKVNPPLRPAVHQSRLFQALIKNDIPILESDHAPHIENEKSHDFASASSGVIGVETMYPMFLYLASKQSLTFPRVVSAVCENPSKLFSLSKGSIKEGYDADFIVVDFKKAQRISSEFLHSKQTMTPFEGFHGIFPNHVYLKGKQIIQEKNLISKPGNGNHVISHDVLS